MAKIPSRCERCGQDFPSKAALQSHRAKDHNNKPPGPPMKAKEKEVKAKEVKTPKAKTPGSASTMEKWMKGEAVSARIGAAIAESRASASASASALPPRQDTPMSGIEEMPDTPNVRTVELDASINLLTGNEAAASPQLNTLTVRAFPPEMGIPPVVEIPGPSITRNSWAAAEVNRLLEAGSRQLEPKPEKKRGRAKYDDEVTGSKKKVDARQSPEGFGLRLREGTPRNLQNAMDMLTQSQNTMEIELGPDTLRGLDEVVNSEEWNAVLQSVPESSNEGGARVDAPAQAQAQDLAPAQAQAQAQAVPVVPEPSYI